MSTHVDSNLCRPRSVLIRTRTSYISPSNNTATTAHVLDNVSYNVLFTQANKVDERQAYKEVASITYCSIQLT